MKQILLQMAVLSVLLVAARADETVRTAQTRLKTDGFYHGAVTGSYDSETAAAVTRYQIRHGLEISGKLDSATAQALGVATPKGATEAEPSPVSGTWRRLRDGDMQFLKEVNSGTIPPPKPAPTRQPVAAPAPTKVITEPGIEPHAPPPRLLEDVPATATPRRHQASAAGEEPRYGTERLRDYVGAFVLAGLDPAVGAELEFFADRVDYFGEKNIGQARIRHDLLRYDRKWPERRFWLAGEVKVDRPGNDRIRVTFPLRYELRHGHQHASGKVRKTLILQKTGGNGLEITGVNERKL